LAHEDLHKGDKTMAKRLMVAFSNAAEGRDEEFNDWYSNVHIPDVCSLEGVLSAARFELEKDNPAAPHQYLTIYELDRDGDAVMADIIENMGSGAFAYSDSIDSSTASLTFWRAR
jgi:hypothetical protein